MTHPSWLVTVSPPLTANVPCTPYQAPAGLAAHNGRPTDTVDHVHSCAAGVTGLRNEAVELVQWRNGRGGLSLVAAERSLQQARHLSSAVDGSRSDLIDTCRLFRKTSGA